MGVFHVLCCDVAVLGDIAVSGLEAWVSWAQRRALSLLQVEGGNS